MTKHHSTDGGTDFDHSERTYRFEYDAEGGERPSVIVVRAVAAVTNTPSIDFDPLYDTIDPDHLDGLFAETDGTASVELSFTFGECSVTVTHDEVRIRTEGESAM
ncbi:HalOD1 output domain-containing protein [Haladaptatus salinisoli]|uniref:HalOD1 output domain-containing protein n=1 Tax=Haladaptatus salinisoli TaxID=2884876 RepID=UPI001D0B10F4|nr:HalOD1 output domain-containing protein [Haladaptatus salinisoli]